jgi:hypothetical protein
MFLRRNYDRHADIDGALKLLTRRGNVVNLEKANDILQIQRCLVLD